MTAIEISAAIKAKKLTVLQVVEDYLKKIKEQNDVTNAFLYVAHEQALARAAEVQAQIDTGELDDSPLAGVPIGIKDNISTMGIETSCASKMLEGYTPVFNAFVIDKLEAAGMIILGKLNMDEFAMGGSSETGIKGAVRNPWDTARVAGGSSGGSAAVVASDLVPLALGTDTGGSIRQPCAFCGVTGIKPTYGAVSRYGAVAFASSLDQIGPIGGNIDDCAALLSVISGKDERDNTSVIDKPFAFGDSTDVKGMKIGIPRNYFSNGIDDEVKNAVLSAARTLEEQGVIIDEFDMPMLDYVVHVYYIIACAEASSNLARFDGIKYGYRSKNAETLAQVYRLSRSEGFGLEVKRRIMLGSFVLSSGYYDAYYKKAMQVRAIIKDEYSKLFQKYDMIISPVAQSTAYKIGENIDDPVKMYMNDLYTASVNLAGLPAAVLPCGFDAAGLPIGFQLIGDAFSEDKLVTAARAFQSVTDYHTKKAGGNNS
ncbi:MAG: Asp-tRNA(Asn)/Glu-tRNA(Gln) amidotransferase subunit GatA [Oscillospiraceae bacterium]|nr:Asp-tRNA(Asn)/Glu-tRNA(Gln) amidotransferase subunit GatA [Oscillospiraceae bacterium]